MPIDEPVEIEDPTVIPGLEKSIPTLDMKARKPLYVYIKSHRHARELERYGEVVFVSQRRGYACLYIDAGKEKEVLAKLGDLKFVKEVKVGHMEALSDDFSAAFLKTNQALKEELEDAEQASAASEKAFTLL